jgi:hypothetical protein
MSITVLFFSMVTKILFCLELLVGNVVKKIIDPYLYTSFVLPKGKKMQCAAIAGAPWDMRLCMQP